MESNDIAMIVQDTYRSYCIANEDLSEVKWIDTADALKAAAINDVELLLNNPDADEEDLHKNWVAFKLTQGWKYGEELSVFRKTHPLMVEYDELSVQQRKLNVKTKLLIALCEIFADVE